MNYRDSSVYVQKQIDSIFKKHQIFAKAYVDDIIVLFQFLEKHFRYFNKIFVSFVKMNVILKSFKIFLKYFIVILLKQKIDSLNLIIFNEKLKTIFVFKFFVTLRHFETYLRKTSYLQHYVSFYI